MINIINPGKKLTHHAISITAFPSLRSEPHDISGGLIPRPKKESPDSAKIEPPTPKVNEIRNIGANNGAKYLKIILNEETLASLSIFIKGLLLIEKLSLLIILAIPIQPVIEITMIKISADAWIYETKARSKKNVGNVRNKSIIIVIDLSIFPLKYPAFIPIKRPIIEEIAAAKNPIISEVWPPSKTLAKTSRPNLSVPKRCSKDGAWSIFIALYS